ncbi:MAG: DUF1467 family protein [Alphaproteobacteria bacterium GM202ARS2]|nr:DUF1467 family protein [Alphaproteobacteria bacterium GM202ARS2]
MSVVSALVLYVVIWWVVFFIVLPWGIEPPSEVAKGHDAGAPKDARLVLKLVITTGVATVLFFVARYGIVSRWIELS